MRLAGFLRKSLVTVAVLAAAGVSGLLLTLPPRARSTIRSTGAMAEGRPGAAVVRGAYHVHSVRSDGSGTIDEIAAAAARAGLAFVLFTDHGDGTRAPLPAAYRSGVLCIDAVEISTTGGHYVALGLPQMPFRLAGEPRDVVEDVARAGGFGIAAHPDSPKRELAWADWDLPFDGLEWLNLDTEWRDETRPRILLGLAQHLLRPVETVGSLVGHPPSRLERWDSLASRRRVVALAAVDAHARFGVETAFGSSQEAVLRVPSYETSFRTIQINALLPRALTGQAMDDAGAVIGAVREGRVYSAIAALAPPGRVELSARAGARTAGMGDFLPPGDDLTVTAAADAPAGAHLRLVCDGRVVRQTSAADRLTHSWRGGAPSTCRLEAGWMDGERFARWIVTNPIYFRSADPARPVPPAPILTEVDTLGDRSRGAAWLVERDPTSRVAVASTGAGAGQRVSIDWALGAGERRGQYAAAVTPDVEALAGRSHLGFVIRADRPTRVSVQVRAPRPGGEPGRWRRSVYADATPRRVIVAIDDMRPVEPTREPRLPRGALRSLLFVIDTVHTTPGASGTFSIEQLEAGQSR
jgi:hypothetical protein